IAGRVAAKGWGLRRVEVLRPSLDAIFNEVVRRRQEAETQTPAAPPAPAESAPPPEPEKTPAA
ncbi:MAG: hypothetical protein K2V38_24370, partial [Gemmataceae bacterium]|nr:hypothetical protein [Gemmataceae bacterium]